MKVSKTLTLALAVAALLGISDGPTAAQSNGARFGSIAYSQHTGRYGSSWSFGDQFDAVEQALASCNRGDCRTLLWFRNSCGALARARNGAIVWASGSSLVDAKRHASNQCTREWGSCKLICSVCSGGNEP